MPPAAQSAKPSASPTIYDSPKPSPPTPPELASCSSAQWDNLHRDRTQRKNCPPQPAPRTRLRVRLRGGALSPRLQALGAPHPHASPPHAFTPPRPPLAHPHATRHNFRWLAPC